MIVITAMLLSLIFLKLGPWGITLTVAVWIGGLALAATTYHDGMKLYWAFKRVEVDYQVLKMKRYTLLRKLLEAADHWIEIETDLMRNVAGTTPTVSFLLERFPELSSMSLARSYISELTEVERGVNGILSERVRTAAAWFQMRDNLYTGWFLHPYSDVPRSLLGYVYDPLLPDDGNGRY